MQSNTSMTYEEELLSKLKDKEYRTAYVESHINNGIAFQIRTLRGDLTQEELGKRAGMKQEAICRLENPNYGSFTLKTLKQIASAFDVGLIVRFVPFSDLVKWDLNLSSESLHEVSSLTGEKKLLKDEIDHLKAELAKQKQIADDVVKDNMILRERAEKAEARLHHKCEWSYDDIYDYYSTTCGDDFALTHGSLEGNKLKYCPYCGGTIKQAMRGDDAV